MSENPPEVPVPQKPTKYKEEVSAVMNNLSSVIPDATMQEAAARKVIAERRLGDRRVKNEQERTLEQAELATKDTLTGLNNRLWLEQELPRIIATSTRTGVPLSIILLDLDRFKAINDTLGHEAGDKALKDVAEVLKRVFSRDSDAIARIGGDEFVIVMEDTPAQVVDSKGAVTGGARFLANELLRELSTHQWSFTDNPPPELIPGASIGIAQHRNEDSQALLNHADVAMYVAKEQGKGQEQVWNPQMAAGPSQQT